MQDMSTQTVCDGTRTIGFIKPCGKHRECYDAEERYIASVPLNDRAGALWVVRKAWERRQEIEAEAEREAAR